MEIENLNEKVSQLKDKYGTFIEEKTGYTGSLLDAYMKTLVENGEKYYGTNFTEDILKERGTSSISWLINEIGTLANSDIQTVNAPQDTNQVQNPTNVPVQTASNEMDLKEQWVHSLIKSGMTEKQARDFAANPYNQMYYDRWLTTKDDLNEPKEVSVPENPQINPIENEKNILLSKYRDLIEKRVFGGHFNGKELNDWQKEQLDNGLEAIIKNGKLHYGENFIEELVNTESLEQVAKILRSLPLVEAREYDNEAAEEAIAEIPVPASQPKEETEPVMPTLDPINNEQETEPIQTPESNTEPVNDIPTEPLQTIPVIENKQTVIPETAMKGKRKEASPSLIDKFKNYWKKASFKKKILIGALAIGAVIGVGAITVTAISQMMVNQSFDSNSLMHASNMVTDAVNNLDVSSTFGADNIDPNVVASTVDPTIANNGVDPNAIVDYSGIGEGTDVHYTQADAISGDNLMHGNENMVADHAEYVNTANEVTNLDGMTNNEIQHKIKH